MKRNSQGFTITEVLIGTFILAVVALGIGQLVMMTEFRSGSESRGECMALVDSTLNSIDSLGVRLQVFDFNPTNAPLTPTDLTSGGLTPPPGIAEHVRFPSDPAYNIVESGGTGSLPIVRNPLLINSAISALTALYNEDPNYCLSERQIYPDPSNHLNTDIVNDETFSTADNLQVFMKIEPYDLNTGNVVGCPPPPLFLRPQKADETVAPGIFQYPQVAGSDAVRSNLGLRVSVRAKFKRGTEEFSCQAQKGYSYYRDEKAPPVPPNTAISGSVSPSPRSTCDMTTPKQLTITLVNTSASFNLEDGSVVVCKDQSQVTDTGTSCTYGGVSYSPNNWDGPWVPCTEVTVCGVAPSSVSPTSGTQTTDKFNYTLTYGDSLPWGCEPRIRLGIIDVAGNVTHERIVPSGSAIEAPPCHPCPAEPGNDYCGTPPSSCLVSSTGGTTDTSTGGGGSTGGGDDGGAPK